MRLNVSSILITEWAQEYLNTLCTLRCTTNRHTFKTLLKSHFFRQAFDIL